MRSWLVLLLTSAFLACARHDSKPPAGFADAHDTSLARLAAALKEYDWEACDFVRARVHANADSLLHEFLNRDSRGDFLGTNEWLNGAVVCPGTLPGPDRFTVIAGYQIEPLTRPFPDTASYRVIYRRLGWTTYDSAGALAVTPDPSYDTLTFILVNTPYGWRVRDNPMPQRVLVDSIHIPLGRGQRARLDSLARLVP